MVPIVTCKGHPTNHRQIYSLCEVDAMRTGTGPLR